LKIIFAGTPELAVHHLKVLIEAGYIIDAVLTRPDKPAGRGRRLQTSPVKQLATEHHIPVHQPKTLRDEQAQSLIKTLAPDLMIVVAYGLILPKAVLDIPRLGCINVHASLLPRWRGASPIHQAILAGDKESGITIMQMDEGMDTGPMLLQASCPIEEMDTAEDLHDRLAQLGPKTLIQALKLLQSNQLKPIKQKDDEATYTRKIKKEDAKIDWQQSAIELSRAIRAYNSWPIAYTMLDGQMVRIWQAIPLETNVEEKPGVIVQLDKDGIDVATGKGVLRIQRLQFPGGKPLPVAAILNSKKEWFEGKHFSIM